MRIPRTQVAWDSPRDDPNNHTGAVTQQPAPAVSLLSDYGLIDEFAGVCRGVIMRACPTAAVLDITHNITRHDVRAGAYALARAVQYMPQGVVMADVSQPSAVRRLVAVQTDGFVLIGPDNGLLSPAVAMLGGASDAVELSEGRFHLPTMGGTFLGRDVLAPCAGAVAAGTPIFELGPAISPASLLPSMMPLPDVSSGRIQAEVLWVDSFGNAQLNISTEELQLAGFSLDELMSVSTGKIQRVAKPCAGYHEGLAHELILLTDAHGLISIAVQGGSAGDVLGISSGSAVVIVDVEDGTTLAATDAVSETTMNQVAEDASATSDVPVRITPKEHKK